MIWNQSDGKKPPGIAMAEAQAAAMDYKVPIGILLGTVERETNFRLGLVSSVGAVGPCQFLPQYASDYYRYAGFKFDLYNWESIRGLAAVYVTYARWGEERYNFVGDDRWRYAVSCHRYGQNSPTSRNMQNKRIRDIEACMRRNGVWYE